MKKKKQIEQYTNPDGDKFHIETDKVEELIEMGFIREYTDEDGNVFRQLTTKGYAFVKKLQGYD